MVPGPLVAFLAARQELIATAEPGTAASRALSSLTDDAIRSLSAPVLAEARGQVAILAMGGWGAGRLLPHSDLDLLVLTRLSREALDPLIRALLYPLWDAGFTVGHQVRTPREHIAALAEDTESLTSFLTARPIAGDERLVARASQEAFRWIRGRAGGPSGKTAAALARIAGRERPGSPYLLEPDLKSGAGGQRDLDELVWCSAILTGAQAEDARELARLGLLTAAEDEALISAQDAITAARWRLHVAAGRGTNTMSIEDAENLGIDADGVQLALATCHHTLLDVRDRLSDAAATRIQQLGIEDLAVIAKPGSADVAVLERAVWDGLLEDAAPGFRELMVLRRPALTHRYTVGAHSLRTVAALGDLGPGILPVSSHAECARALLVAALAHDVGKRLPGGGHSARGAIETRAIARRFGLLPAETEAAAALVSEHLLLPKVALAQDLTDENVVLEAAARIRDLRLVAPLYQLSVADMRATGPDVWTPWRTARMGDLAAKLERALSPDVDGAGIVASAETTRADAIRTAASVGSSRSVLRFLEDAPLRYLATHPAETVLRDARLVQSLTGPGGAREIAFDTRPGPTPGTRLLDIATRDRPGLFASIAGAIELTGLNVLSAEAFTTQSGVAIDTFTIVRATRAEITQSTWDRFERHLHEALKDHGAFTQRLDERRRHYERHCTGGSPVRAQAGPQGSFGTTIAVRAADRAGLLYDLAHTLEQAELDIRRAVVTTIAGRADDTFEVTDAEGAPPDPAALTAALVPALERAGGSSRR